MGEREQAQKLSQAMLAPAEVLRNRLSLRNALWINGTLCRSEGNWQDARNFLERTIPMTSTRIHSDLAVLDYQVGDAVQGTAHVERVVENPPAGST